MLFGDPQTSSNKNRERSPHIVLTCGLSEQLEEYVVDSFHVVGVEDVEQAVRVLQQENVAAVVFGSRIGTTGVVNLLGSIAAENRAVLPAVTIVLCVNQDWAALQDFVDANQIYYVAREGISTDQLWKLILSGIQGSVSGALENQDLLAADSDRAEYLLNFCTQLAMQDELASAGRLLIETARDILQANIVQCYVFDSKEGTLTPADASEGEKWSYSAASGLAAFVAHTGQPVCLDQVDIDPRYDPDIDAPPEMRNASFLAQPIIGAHGLPSGVLTAVRNSEQAPFSDLEIRLIQVLAECASPTLNEILLQSRVQTLLTRRASGSEANVNVFRQEAVDYHMRNWEQHGEVLKVLPLWLQQSFWVMLALFLASLGGLSYLVHRSGVSLGK